MARKKRRYSKRKKLLRQQEKKWIMSPETERGVVFVGLLALCLITILSLAGKAGALGRIINDALFLSFGWGRFLVPFILFAIAFLKLREGKEKDLEDSKEEEDEAYKFTTIGALNYLGFLLLFVSLLAVFHIFQKEGQRFEVILSGSGGGYVGYIVSYPFLKTIGAIGSFIILFALSIIGLLVGLNASLFDIKTILEKLHVFPEKISQEKEVSIKGRKASLIVKNGNQKGIRKGLLEKIGARTQSIDLKQKARERQEYYRDPSFEPLPLSLLSEEVSIPASGNVEKNASIIQKTLADFGIEVEIGEINIGPTVTQYTVRPKIGVKLSQITTLQNDLSLALAAHPIRIEAPIPGKSWVGMEVPNKKVATVRLRGILESEELRKFPSNLKIALGRNVAGNPEVADLKTMPHLLVAGATGSGKTVCLNSIITTLLYQNSPKTLKFIIIDPKRVDLTLYNDIPHLLTPIVTDTQKAINALRWCCQEMERRYNILSEAVKQNIENYNRDCEEKMPYIVIIIDELADLMHTAGRDAEQAIVRLAQLSRAVGLHLIVATQRPSVDVITGLIKANITARIAFLTASQIDSRTIIDSAGAEKLLGNGDMLYLPADIAKPKRLQGAYISEEEIKKVVDFLREKTNPQYNNEVLEEQKNIFPKSGLKQDIDDELFNEAAEVVILAGKGSASLLQRRLRIGYARAARLLDMLEARGAVGPQDGSKPREVLIENIEELENMDTEEEIINEELDTRH
ncbi:cell division protein FtsK [bacterium (Candidatus Torokbacteria) CG_4_10_14_0_2_um_filter_35_8]|nr:MAG: cell division protein FtsK [bacterium (Candidatus Torokbacteria) CG_4_10_14_0_2_um_filter_35_8]